MANRLKMAEHQAIIGLARLNWSYRRIAAELGVDRQTVSRHVKASSLGDPPGVGPPEANAAISITGSGASEAGTNATIAIAGLTGRRSCCEPWREMVVAGLEQGLTAQRIWQDLKSEHGFA